MKYQLRPRTEMNAILDRMIFEYQKREGYEVTRGYLLAQAFDYVYENIDSVISDIRRIHSTSEKDFVTDDELAATYSKQPVDNPKFTYTLREESLSHFRETVIPKMSEQFEGIKGGVRENLAAALCVRAFAQQSEYFTPPADRDKETD